jgi:transposase
MPEHRRKFSPQFKAEAVQMVIETGKPIAQVARDLGIHDGTLRNWVNAWRRQHPEPDQPLSPVEHARVKELEDEVARLRMENEFLKKQRPSSPGRSRSEAVRGDRRGEGQLQDAVRAVMLKDLAPSCRSIAHKCKVVLLTDRGADPDALWTALRSHPDTQNTSKYPRDRRHCALGPQHHRSRGRITRRTRGPARQGPQINRCYGGLWA